MSDTHTVRFIVEVTAAKNVNTMIVADALLDFLCGGGDVPFPDELVDSIDRVDPA